MKLALVVLPFFFLAASAATINSMPIDPLSMDPMEYERRLSFASFGLPNPMTALGLGGNGGLQAQGMNMFNQLMNGQAAKLFGIDMNSIIRGISPAFAGLWDGFMSNVNNAGQQISSGNSGMSSGPQKAPLN